MDIAWKLGTGSKADDWELRMSMRSFWANVKPITGYWIIGHIPQWIDRKIVNCLPWPDPYRRCKDANLIHKALRLAMEPKVSDPFIFCSDDQMILQQICPEDFKSWHCGEIAKEASAGMNKWQRRLFNTGVRLRAEGYPAMNYEGHIPYKLHKSWIREALRFDFPTKPGMCVHSTIINCSSDAGVPLKEDTIRAWLGVQNMTVETVDRMLAKNRFASLNNHSLKNAYLVSTIEHMFPEAAPWEQDCR